MTASCEPAFQQRNLLQHDGSSFTDLELDFFRRGDELADETPDDFSDLDEVPDRPKRLADLVWDQVTRAAALASARRG